MKTFLTTGIILLIMLSGVFAQSSESEVSKEFYKSDGHLSIVINYIPKGWNFSASEHQFKITSPDTVWVLEENPVNAVAENKDAKIKRIKANGIRVVPEIIIRYEDKWSPDKIQQLKIQNAAIDDEINKLPKKYNIVQLRDKKLSTKNQTIYTGNNEKEKGLIEQYNKEKSVLEAKKTILPDFHSDKYSLFITSLKGNIDNLHSVYPEKPSLELYTIISTFREVCGK
jgi:hypothetical protein